MKKNRTETIRENEAKQGKTMENRLKKRKMMPDPQFSCEMYEQKSEYSNEKYELTNASTICTLVVIKISPLDMTLYG